MGNACCGAKEESPKPSALTSRFSVDSGSLDQTGASQTQFSSAAQQHQAAGGDLNSSATNNNLARLSTNSSGLAESSEVDKATREEESRLELLVQTAGRAMVAVRSTRGSIPYYDQGFAAALAQHLEQTTKFPSHAPALPAAPAEASTDSAAALDEEGHSSVYKRLAQPAWEDLSLGIKGGLAGCAGENPEKYLDHVAESFLDEVVPKKEQLFTKSKPIVESLL